MTSSLPRLSRPQGWLLAFGLIVVLLLLWFLVFREEEVKGPPPPNPWAGPVPVRVVPAIKEDLLVRVRALGSVTPLNTVVVRSRADGPLVEILFNEGQEVEAGTLLARIDPAPYEVRLAQAEGTLQQTRAQLRSAEDDLVLYQRLIAQNSIPRQQLDKQEALVDQLKGTLKNHQAQRDDVKLQLSYTRIEAPISGRLGMRRLDLGNLISSGDSNGLVTLTQTQPIAVSFTVAENQLAAVRRAFTDAAAQEQGLAVEAWDRSERQQLASGVLTTLDNQIDAATGTLRLKAEFANEDDSLFPNQFVNVRLQLQTLKDAITIPADAVQYGGQGPYVFVIDDEENAQVRTLEVGALEADRIAVLSGLNEGERVVLEGLDRLREGRRVQLME